MPKSFQNHILVAVILIQIVSILHVCQPRSVSRSMTSATTSSTNANSHIFLLDVRSLLYPSINHGCFKNVVIRYKCWYGSGTGGKTKYKLLTPKIEEWKRRNYRKINGIIEFMKISPYLRGYMSAKSFALTRSRWSIIELLEFTANFSFALCFVIFTRICIKFNIKTCIWINLAQSLT